jgi:excinuclease ABC subunit B
LHGTAILYADVMTDSMRAAIGETERRRAKQVAHNEANGIQPRSVHKRIKDIIDGVYQPDENAPMVRAVEAGSDYATMDEKALAKAIKKLEKDMIEFAKNLEFEKAAKARDELFRLRQRAFGADHH